MDMDHHGSILTRMQHTIAHPQTSKDPHVAVDGEASQLSPARLACRISPPTAEMRMHQPEAWPRGGIQAAGGSWWLALEVHGGRPMEVGLQ